MKVRRWNGDGDGCSAYGDAEGSCDDGDAEAAKKKADEEAAKKKADEEAAKKKADEEAAAKKDVATQLVDLRAQLEAAKKEAEAAVAGLGTVKAQAKRDALKRAGLVNDEYGKLAPDVDVTTDAGAAELQKWIDANPPLFRPRVSPPPPAKDPAEPTNAIGKAFHHWVAPVVQALTKRA
ncbi:MAG: hypothetical protein AMXMBFR64_05020 [Myxococcales bacterium]